MSGVIRPLRAIAGEHVHRHYRNDGRGYVSHQHVCRSERHSHPGQELAFVHMVWTTWSWHRALGSAIYLVEVLLWVALASSAVLGWFFFVRTLAH
jgi:hypothetical protein